MDITVDRTLRSIVPGTTLGEVLKRFSPFGDEPVIAKRNGTVLREEDNAFPAEEGDDILIYPLVIGG